MVVNAKINVGGNVGLNIGGKYGSNIIWLIDTEVYVGGKMYD